MRAASVFLNYIFKPESNNFLDECIPGCLLTPKVLKRKSAQKQSEVLFLTVGFKGISCPRNILFHTMYICIYYINIYNIFITLSFRVKSKKISFLIFLLQPQENDLKTEPASLGEWRRAPRSSSALPSTWATPACGRGLMSTRLTCGPGLRRRPRKTQSGVRTSEREQARYTTVPPGELAWFGADIKPCKQSSLH